MSDVAPLNPSLRVSRTTLVVLIVAPAALFGPAILGLPGDAGLLAVIAAIALLRPHALRQAFRSSAFQILSGLAVMSLVASGHVDRLTSVYLAKFIAGVLTGFALHFLYVSRVTSGSVPRRPTATVLAAYIAVISFFSMTTGLGNPQLATPSLTLSAALVFYLLRPRARLAFLAIAVPAFLLLNSKSVLLALIAGCLVLGNMRVDGDRGRFLLTRAAGLAGVLLPLSLLALWYANPERFDDLANPTRSNTTMARYGLAVAGVSAFLDNPVLGLGGYGMNIDYNFARYYDESYLADLIAAGVVGSHAAVYGSGFTSGVHNMYLDYLTTYGGLSAAILLVLVARGIMISMKRGYVLKIAAAVTILVLGTAWQYTASAFGTALLMFACWPFRFTRRFGSFRLADTDDDER